MTKQIEEKISEAVHAVKPSAEFSQYLLRRIKATPQKEAVSKRSAQWRWIPVLAAFALVIAFIAASPQSVWASLRGLFNFLPGVGIIEEDDNTLYLAGPASAEQMGVALTIDQVISDGNQTVVAFHSDELPNGGSHCAYNVTRLLLPDGKTLLPTGGGNGIEDGKLQARVQFFPLPEGVRQATLYEGVDPDDPETALCTDPKEWKVDFRLSTTKPADVKTLPVVESTAESTAAVGDNGVKIFIDKSVALDDGYMIYGHFDLSNPNWSRADFNYTELRYKSLSAQDAAGKEITLEPGDVIRDAKGINVDQAFAIKVVAKDFSAPLTLHVSDLWITAIYDPENFGIPVFSFDAGADPQVGQSWEINKEVDVNGIKIDFQAIEVVQESSDQGRDEGLEKGYAITVGKISEGYFSGSYFCQGDGDGKPDYGEGSSDKFIYYYSGGLPHGQVTCRIGDAHFLLPGDWKIEWQPPTGGIK